jgi:hypothetical protein
MMAISSKILDNLGWPSPQPPSLENPELEGYIAENKLETSQAMALRAAADRLAGPVPPHTFLYRISIPAGQWGAYNAGNPYDPKFGYKVK